MDASCDFTMGLIKDAGFQTVNKVPTDGQPGIFATLDAGAKRTMDIYFMYDVKQVVPSEWSPPPYEAALVDKPGNGKVTVGRGAVNQKGPEGAFLAALHAFRAAGKKLPINLVLVAEGEEEIGSPHFHEIVERPEVLAALKKCEGVIIPTSWQGANGAVQINLGSKGIIEIELISSGEKWGRGPMQDLHPSQKARVDSPVWHLLAALQTLVTPDGNTPAIDGWFENVRPLTAREETAENSRVIRAQQAVYARAGVETALYPRNAGSWPGCVFTGAPVSLPAGQFGLGQGSGAHGPNEYFVVDSSNPKVEGLVVCTMGFVDFLYEMATIA